MAQPEKFFRAGACTASVWANEIDTAKGKVPVKSESIDRAYKGKSGEFQHTASLGLKDIPKAMLALSKAYEYMAMDERAD